MKTLSALAAAFVSLSLAAVTGCSTGDDSGASLRLGGDVDTRATGSSVCPGPGSAFEPSWYQERATRVAGYVLGGEDWRIDPRTGKPDELVMKHEAECKYAAECVDYMRNSLIAGDKRQAVASVTPATESAACGMKAGTFSIDWYEMPLPEEMKLVEDCSVRLDACFDTGVSGFFFVRPPAPPSGEKCGTEGGKGDKQGTFSRDGSCGGGPAPVIRLEIDPMPASTTAPLAGTSGATAAAVYLATGTSTNVVKWTTAYSYGTVAAGTPCSNSDLAIGDTAYKSIQASGVFRRCY